MNSDKCSFVLSLILLASHFISPTECANIHNNSNLLSPRSKLTQIDQGVPDWYITFRRSLTPAYGYPSGPELIRIAEILQIDSTRFIAQTIARINPEFIAPGISTQFNLMYYDPAIANNELVKDIEALKKTPNLEGYENIDRYRFINIEAQGANHLTHELLHRAFLSKYLGNEGRAKFLEILLKHFSDLPQRMVYRSLETSKKRAIKDFFLKWSLKINKTSIITIKDWLSLDIDQQLFVNEMFVRFATLLALDLNYTDDATQYNNFENDSREIFITFFENIKLRLPRNNPEAEAIKDFYTDNRKHYGSTHAMSTDSFNNPNSTGLLTSILPGKRSWINESFLQSV